MKSLVRDRDDLEQAIADFVRAVTEQADRSAHFSKAASPPEGPVYLRRLAGRIGERVHVLKTESISIIGSEEGTTYALRKGRKYYLNEPLNQLQQTLDPDMFIRIHRGYLVNVEHIRVIDRWPGGKYLITIDDVKELRITSSRAGAERLRQSLGLRSRQENGNGEPLG